MNINKLIDSIEYVNREYPKYRIGDLVFLRNDAMDMIKRNNIFLNTFAMEYLNRLDECGRVYDIDILSDIIIGGGIAGNFQCPNNNELVLQIRMGDIKRLSRGWEIDNIINIISSIIKRKNIKSITIVTAFHNIKHIRENGILPKKNIEVLKILLPKLDELNIPIDIHSSKNADEDLYYSAMAKNLIITGGFFSLICGLVNKNNVYGSTEKNNARLKIYKKQSFIENDIINSGYSSNICYVRSHLIEDSLRMCYRGG